MTTAALGGEIDAPTLDGGRTRVKVPAGVQSGKQLRLRGKGMPALRGSGGGDLYIELAVETPVNLTARQKELLQEFEQAGARQQPRDPGLLLAREGLLGGDEGLTPYPRKRATSAASAAARQGLSAATVTAVS